MEKDNPIIFNGDDRDQVLLALIDQDRLRHANSHLGDQYIKSRPYKYKSESENKRGYTYYSEFKPFNVDRDGISLVMAPAWGVVFPPYNLARLTAVLRQHGYSAKVHDLNIECYTHATEQSDIDYWDGTYYYAWMYPSFDTTILPIIRDVLDRAVDKILADGTDIIGFSIYNTNLMASMYMITKIKSSRPDMTIVIGGPEAFDDNLQDRIENRFGFPRGLINYRIKGEGEHEIILLLEKFRTQKNGNMVPLGGLKSKINLNELPFPDYTDYNLSLYKHPDGVSIETSRGCIAQCSFCAETWFWKYRWRTSDRVVAEMQYQIDTYGVNRFWFVDSLANGNLKEFSKLIDLIIDKKLNIRWNSYARCDGRMDLDFFKRIADSGCMALSFGVESGSKAVLDSMKKKINVNEIEDNLRDGAIVGLKNHVNWLVGFPSEGPSEFLHSLHVIHNCRNWICVISPGFTCGDAAFSDMHENWKDYNIAWVNKPEDNTFLDTWYTTDYQNTILHRFIRLKFMQIWLEIVVEYGNGSIINAQSRPTLKNLYTIEFDDGEHRILNYVPQQSAQNFNYFAGNTQQQQLSASLANEFLPYAWILFKVYGAFTANIIFDFDKDLVEFNGSIVRRYWANVAMQVSKDGRFVFDITHRLEHKNTSDYNHIKDTNVDPINMSFSEKHSLDCYISEFDGD
jgi:anaerobic magnesium-protoporphyrin IX monomethyl ester cyclase